MRLPPNDYLKYWRVIRYFILKKYKLTTGELDVLLFLYSEKYFSKDKFNEFDELISWDVNRFDRLLRDGWVVVFRKRQGKKKALYEVSYKGRRMLGSMYKKLSGEEIPEGLQVSRSLNTFAAYYHTRNRFAVSGCLVSGLLAGLREFDLIDD